MHGKEGWVVEYPGRRGHRHEYPDGHVREHIKRAIEYKKPSFWKIFGAGAILTFVLLDDAFGVVADEPLAAECFIMLYPDAVEYYYCDICGEKWYD